MVQIQIRKYHTDRNKNSAANRNKFGVLTLEWEARIEHHLKRNEIFERRGTSEYRHLARQ